MHLVAPNTTLENLDRHLSSSPEAATLLLLLEADMVLRHLLSHHYNHPNHNTPQTKYDLTHT
jgi:hypothetical protein